MLYPDKARYKFNRDGTIIDQARGNFHKKGAKMQNGNYNIKLIDVEGFNHTYLLSRIIWWAFTGDQLTRSDVIVHIDGDKSNNAIWNLEKISRIELGCTSPFCNPDRQNLTCPKCGHTAIESPKMIYHIKVCDGTLTPKFLYKIKKQNQEQL